MRKRPLPVYTQVTVIMKTGNPRRFRASGIEWRETSTFEKVGERSKGPWLVVLGEAGEVVAELLKDAIRGYEIEEREDIEMGNYLRRLEEELLEDEGEDLTP